jgi:hypothetical protein
MSLAALFALVLLASSAQAECSDRSAAGEPGDGTRRMHLAQEMPTDTRISCLSDEYGVGYTVRVWPETCDVYDAPSRARFGVRYSAPGHGRIVTSWAVWSLDSIPADAEIVRVDIEHYLWPDEDNDPLCSMAYGVMDFVPIPPPECEELSGLMNSSDYYVSTRVGSTPELRRRKLGSRAVADVQSHVMDQSPFAVSIRYAWGPVHYGGGQIPGWDSGGVDLIVSWRRATPVEHGTWSVIKAMYRGQGH